LEIERAGGTRGRFPNFPAVERAAAEYRTKLMPTKQKKD